MKKLIISKIDNYDYTLVDESRKSYNLNIEFYTRYKPQMADIIYIDESILEEKNLFAFCEIDDNDNADIKDIAKVVNNNKEYYFKRVYG